MLYDICHYYVVEAAYVDVSRAALSLLRTWACAKIRK